MFTTEQTRAVISEVFRRKPMHRGFLKRSIAQLSDLERTEADRYIEFLQLEGFSAEQLARAYLVIVEDTFREELRFRESGRYRYSTFAEAREAVYDNPGYMQDYMVGLALSSYWWHNHALMRRFFKESLGALAAAGPLYREVGPGHGIYFLEALRSGLFQRYEGIDVSRTSIDLTRRIVESGYFGSMPSATLLHADFLAADNMARADVLVMGEVLEHVENPGLFLERAHSTTTATCRLFLTTCINAPAIDHLYNPGSVAALEALFADQGFGVVDRCVLGRDGKSPLECEREKLAINVAYVLRKHL